MFWAVVMSDDRVRVLYVYTFNRFLNIYSYKWFLIFVYFVYQVIMFMCDDFVLMQYVHYQVPIYISFVIIAFAHCKNKWNSTIPILSIACLVYQTNMSCIINRLNVPEFFYNFKQCCIFVKFHIFCIYNLVSKPKPHRYKPKPK